MTSILLNGAAMMEYRTAAGDWIRYPIERIKITEKPELKVKVFCDDGLKFNASGQLAWRILEVARSVEKRAKNKKGRA
jgi:hypothetical protein